MKRIAAILVCLLLVFASGCEFFSVPTASPAVSGTADITSEPSSTTDDTTATPEPSLSPTEESSTAPTDETTAEPTEKPTEESTAEPTDEPTVEPTATPNPTEGMIFPDSDTKLIKWSSLIALSAAKLDLARNEIFAREGYKFTKTYYIDYYSKLSWYSEDPAFSESKFTQVQNANITLIRVAENAKKGLLYYIPSGTSLDFDQDGTLDKLTYAAPDDYHMNLKMKDGSVTTPWSIECEQPSKKVYLGDINFKDGMLDLFVDEAGPSDDYAIHVAGVKHHSFLKRTTTIPLPGTVKQLKLDGKGSISTQQRMNILMTWFTGVKYKLSTSGKLTFVTQSSYSMNNFKCKTKVAIPLKASASTSAAVAFTIPAGTSVTLVSTDDKKWIKIKAPAGTGWLQMADLTNLTNPAISATDAFDGLIIAD
jgi:hypothetical protein